MLVVVHRRTNSGILSVDGAFDPDMREALANAAQRYGLPVGLPSVATLQSNQISLDTTKVAPGDRLSKVAELSDGELPLFGDLRWSDSALGWVVTWSIEARGRRYRRALKRKDPAFEDNKELGAPLDGNVMSALGHQRT
jgi:hypothetical protein